ncbi:DUF882 domain-containing protein [Neptuniibacter sp.]|uniref:DUF882 domain-containing protein n=1 Tax=Neptuniibacter sp. TaxID=1962643 RepID=UPI00262AABC5|nr:DUF882 domain-containing protein [Neptuniibacter sp.]MCP4595183.1 DUF882 domain-containing protein [Neptuniibacter sp.]
MKDRTTQSRRDFLKALGGVTALTALPSTALAKFQTNQDHSLSLVNLHTGEALNSTFYSDGIYQADSLQALNHVLRDHRNNKVHNMDQQLLMLLHDLQQTFGEHKPIHIISAYRSPESNELLRQKSNKVAKRSYHMLGQAVDIRIPGVDIKDLHKASLAMRSGGVGLYTRSNFVHLDVGRVRNWGK